MPDKTLEFDEDDHDHELADGEIYDIIRLIGRKHALKIIHTIKHKPLSFNEIRSRLGLSASMLSSLLSDLQMKLIIEKKQVTSNPVRYVYEITDEFGIALCSILGELIVWSRRVEDESTRLSITKVKMGS